MSQFSPASVLYDASGNPIGVLQDGAFYRLQVEAKLTEGDSLIGKVQVVGEDEQEVISAVTRNRFVHIRVDSAVIQDSLREVARLLRRIEYHLEAMSDESIGGLD